MDDIVTRLREIIERETVSLYGYLWHFVRVYFLDVRCDVAGILGTGITIEIKK